MKDSNNKPALDDVKKKSPTEIDGDKSGYQPDPRRNPEKKKPEPVSIDNENPHGGKHPTR